MSDMFTVKIEGVKELQSKFKALDKELQIILSQAVSAGAAVVERDAKIRCPVDTGALRRSLREMKQNKTPGRIESQVGTDIEYAPHVEFGTRYQRAQPYLRPALDENTNEIQAAFETRLNQLIGRYK
jgi:HK97 gp10 family phage protein